MDKTLSDIYLKVRAWSGVIHSDTNCQMIYNTRIFGSDQMWSYKTTQKYIVNNQLK